MGVEIERKFLVIDDTWRARATSSTRIVQGYLASSQTITVRVRIKGDRAYLTIKGATTGIARSEYEYEIPVPDATGMLDEMAEGGVVDKVRHIVPFAGHTWEVDVFAGENTGLIMAEVELTFDGQDVTRPGWAGEEVSGDPRFYNVYLSAHPYTTWPGGAGQSGG